MKYTLNQLGWDDHWQSLLEEEGEPHLLPARIARVNRSDYNIVSLFGEGRAYLSGSFLDSCRDGSDFPTVGDWILVDSRQDIGNALRLHSLLPRRTEFTRQTSGRDHEGRRTSDQIVAGNVDTFFLLFGLDHPIRVRLVERYLTLVASGGAQPVIVLNKSDLRSDLEECIAKLLPIAGEAPICTVSALHHERIEGITKFVENGKTVAFLGSSGVGKSTLINAILDEERLKTGALRQGDLRGRHTTTWREMIVLPQGGILIDTPGMREVQLHGDETALERSFPDVYEIASQCRFANCTHSGEPGCTIEAALGDGTLTAYRFKSYETLKNETQFAEKQERARELIQVKRKKRKRKERAQRRDRCERQASKALMRDYQGGLRDEDFDGEFS